jgi:hypothetical protein
VQFWRGVGYLGRFAKRESDRCGNNVRHAFRRRQLRDYRCGCASSNRRIKNTVIVLLSFRRRYGYCSFDHTHARKAALGRLTTRIKRKNLLQCVPLLGAGFGDGGKHEPNLWQIRLLRNEGTQECA